MGTTSGGIDPPESNPKSKEIEGSKNIEASKKVSYASLLKNEVTGNVVNQILPKPVVMLHGEPSITWNKKSDCTREFTIRGY